MPKPLLSCVVSDIISKTSIYVLNLLVSQDSEQRFGLIVTYSPLETN